MHNRHSFIHSHNKKIKIKFFLKGFEVFVTVCYLLLVLNKTFKKRPHMFLSKS